MPVKTYFVHQHRPLCFWLFNEYCIIEEVKKYSCYYNFNWLFKFSALTSLIMLLQLLGSILLLSFLFYPMHKWTSSYYILQKLLSHITFLVSSSFSIYTLCLFLYMFYSVVLTNYFFAISLQLFESELKNSSYEEITWKSLRVGKGNCSLATFDRRKVANFWE